MRTRKSVKEWNYGPVAADGSDKNRVLPTTKNIVSSSFFFLANNANAFLNDFHICRNFRRLCNRTEHWEKIDKNCEKIASNWDGAWEIIYLNAKLIDAHYYSFFVAAVKFGRMSKKQREKVEDEVRFHRAQMRAQNDAAPDSSVYDTQTPSSSDQLHHGYNG